MSFELGLVKLVGSEWYGEGRMVQIMVQKRENTEISQGQRRDLCCQEGEGFGGMEWEAGGHRSSFCM